MSGTGDDSEIQNGSGAGRAPELAMVASYAAEWLMTSPDWMKAMDQVLEGVGLATGAACAALLQRQAKGGVSARLFCLHLWQAPDERNRVDPSDLEISVSEQGLFRWVELLQEGHIVSGSLQDFAEAERAFMDRQRVRSLAAIPVVVGGEWWGVLCLIERERERDWQPFELDQLARVSGLLALAIQRKREKDALRMECERAKAATVQKSKFLATMSHEIRDPISGVVGMLRLLSRTPLSVQQRRYVTSAVASADGLLDVVNDVLDFSRIEAGKLVLQCVEFRPADLLGDLRGMFEERGKRKGLGFVAAVDGSVPGTVRGDAARLRQILVNFLSNAVKFTDAGGLVVRCLSVGGDAETVRLRFEVKDTGIGMTPAQAAEVFDSYAQAHVSISRERGGTGLGLAICKQLVELLGGTIGVESEEEMGSTFWFEVPMERSTRHIPPAPRVEYVEREDTTLRREKVRVLLVEDNVINQEVAMEIMHQAGYACDCVGNGADAVEAVFSRAYDLVIMDCQMPILDGYEATRRIRSREAEAAACGASDQHVLIIALTAHAMEGDRERCLQVGMDDYLAKPLEPEQLIGAVDHWLTRHTRPVLKALDRTGDEDGQATEGATSRDLDIERFLKRCMGNRELAGRLLSKFEQQTEVDLEAIRTGMRSGDISSLRAAAHRLKGAAANLSAEPVRACAAALYSTSAGVPAAEMEARIVTLEEAIIRLHSSIGELKTKLTTVG